MAAPTTPVLTLTGKSIVTAEGADVASAATTNIWTTDGDTVHITGTDAITSFGTAPQAGAHKWVIFDGALTLTHGANLNIPGAANITTAAGDVARVYADTTTQFDIQIYTRSDGTSVAAPRANQGSSLVYIETLDLTSDTIVNDLGSTYDVHVFVLTNVLPVTSTADLQVTVSADNGSTFANSSYGQCVNGTSVALTVFRIANSLSNAAGNLLQGELRLFRPHATSVRKYVTWDTVYTNSAGNELRDSGGGNAQDNSPDVVTAAVNAIKFAVSGAGYSSGTLRHYGIKNS